MATKLFRRNEPPRRPSLPDPTGSTGTTPRRNSLPFLPRRGRRRALTPPFLDNAGSSSRQPKFIEQDRSLLLFELPYELREQIYLEVLGEGPIRLEDVDERTGTRKKGMKKVCRWAEETGVVSLMQSCRQAYTELHPLLYATHTIVIPSLGAFRHLTSAMLPSSHLTLLTSLYLNLYFPYILFPIRTVPPAGSFASKLIKQLQHFDLPGWRWTWDVLGDLCRKGGLTQLRTKWTARDYTNMHADWPKRPDPTVAKLMWDPIMAFAKEGGEAALRVWEIEVTWPLGEEDGEGGPPEVAVADWPFELRTVVGEVAAEEDEEEEEVSGEEHEDTQARRQGRRPAPAVQRSASAIAFAGSSAPFGYVVPSS